MPRATRAASRCTARCWGEFASKTGLHLEFGVYKGNSINHFAEASPDVTWYGFNSFEGLPEAWTLGAKAGAFSIGGNLPPVRGNVRLTRSFSSRRCRNSSRSIVARRSRSCTSIAICTARR